MTQNVAEVADFVFMQLNEQKPGIYDSCHPDCATWDKIDLVWEEISHETKESGS
jgi:hypothetical protein